MAKLLSIVLAQRTAMLMQTQDIVEEFEVKIPGDVMFVLESRSFESTNNNYCSSDSKSHST